MNCRGRSETVASTELAVEGLPEASIATTLKVYVPSARPSDFKRFCSYRVEYCIILGNHIAFDITIIGRCIPGQVLRLSCRHWPSGYPVQWVQPCLQKTSCQSTVCRLSQRSSWLFPGRQTGSLQRFPVLELATLYFLNSALLALPAAPNSVQSAVASLRKVFILFSAKPEEPTAYFASVLKCV